MRADLALQVERFVKLTRAEAAKRLGVTQPRLNQLLRGKLSDFSLDVLVNMLAYAAMRVDVKCGRSREV